MLAGADRRSFVGIRIGEYSPSACITMFINFTLTLSGGMLAVLATGRLEQVAWKFLRLVSFLVFAMACTVTLWYWRDLDVGVGVDAGYAVVVAGGLVAFAALVLAVIAPLAPRRAGLVRAICGVGGLAGVVGACMLALGAVKGEDGISLARFMLVVSQVLAALLLGSMTIAWLLGHAYLTATKMTIEPLRHFSRMVSWSVGARILFAAVSAALAWYLSESGGTGAWGQLSNSWLILSLRVGVGLLGVGVFAYMVADCVRLRSTQSATGILYFGSIFAYVGELAACQLVAECGWPL